MKKPALKLEFSSPFIFTVCQVGAEATLKKEIARDYPHLRFAYSRPGFVTFKHFSAKPLPSPWEFQLQSVFARAYGVSIGKVALPEGVVSNPQGLSIIEIAHSLSSELKIKALHLHVWERDFYLPGEEPKGFVADELASALEKQIRNQDDPIFAPSRSLQNGDWVLDVIVLENNETWVGFHQHSAFHSPVAGGKFSILLPELAPSRAYLKLEEALIWSQAPIQAGDIAVEVGSAPGGASYALLQRGLQVVGIDPGEMAPIVLKHPHFNHLQKSIDSVRRNELPRNVHWLLLDMNVQPKVSLASIERMVPALAESLLGVVLTVKLNEWKLARHIPDYLQKVRDLGMIRARAVQLAKHRQEILIFGITRKGAIRNK